MRNKENLTASLAQQPPTVHNYTPSKAGEYFALAAIGAMALPLLWFFACGVYSELGSQQPGHDLAFTIIAVVLLGLVTKAGCAIVSKVGDFILQLRQQTWDGKARLAQVELLAAQTAVTSSRTLDYQDSKAMLALEILQEAYNHKGDYSNGEKRPWLGDNPNGIAREKNITIKHFEGRRMGIWLKNHELITEDDQLNRAQFKDYKDAMRYIQSLYALPIQVNNRPAPYQEQTSIIDI